MADQTPMEAFEAFSKDLSEALAEFMNAANAWNAKVDELMERAKAEGAPVHLIVAEVMKAAGEINAAAEE